MVAGLLFGSGLSALVYQTVWLREFRLIFGASTSATAAVLAIFMGGLGIGSALLGKRADLRESPLGFYASLEILIALAAAFSVPLLWLVRSAYLAFGGSVDLGIVLATVVRLVLATIVLGIPTFLMGGTLPAAARAVETSGDSTRRNLSVLYATNTCGAVVGTLLSTFFMLENLGNRQTLLVAVLLNLIVGITARSLSRRMPVEAVEEPSEPIVAAKVPPRLVLVAAAVFGFTFLLMELVWYRMLGPLLGGTTFTFGLILAIALLGIGLGGALYSAASVATPGALAVTAALEALAMIVPFVLGDRLALLANLLRSLGKAGFGGHVLAWSALTGIVVFPAALVAGFQFPLLIALLGRGRADVGRHVGLAYAWNTAGAIAGSLAGGFGLLPLLTAPGAWRFVAVLLALTAIVISAYALRGNLRVAAASVFLALLAASGTLAVGPTAFWRHGGIGAGRLAQPQTPNEARDQAERFRRQLVWDADGRESSVAIMNADDLSFIVNGKADGSARGDAGTQVMSGVIGTLLHPNPRKALVIGLGTGSTAGWLAATVQRVDVVELEPVVNRVARDCAGVNRGVMALKNVKVMVADAREVLLTTDERYDVIFSEPSNPYRAGIASLFTQEFYEAVSERLNPDGMFLQWVQAYDIDAATLRTIYATLNTTFPHVDTYWTTPGDLVLVATRKPLLYNYDRMRARLRGSAQGAALHYTWRVETVEGFLSHFIANDAVAREVAKLADELNTDDRTVIEFGFARGLDVRQFVVAPLARFAGSIGGTRPSKGTGTIDWTQVALNRASSLVIPLSGQATDAERAHQEFVGRFERGDRHDAANWWVMNDLRPTNSGELAAAAESFAETTNPRSETFSKALAEIQPAEADAIAARYAFKQHRFADAARLLQSGFERHRKSPWPNPDVMRRGLETAMQTAGAARETAIPLYDALEKPFMAGQLEEARRLARLNIAMTHEECGQRTITALLAFEPHPRWTAEHLSLRARCYPKAGLKELAEKAEDDYLEYLQAQPQVEIR
jgi:predicted membrane-bound spermidine synthase